MLGHVISQVQQKAGTLITQCIARVSQLRMLCSIIIVVGIDRVTLIAQYIKSQFAQILLSIKPCLAQFTNQVLLIKAGIMIAILKLGALGQQLLTIVRQILQRALSLVKRDK